MQNNHFFVHILQFNILLCYRLIILFIPWSPICNKGIISSIINILDTSKTNNFEQVDWISDAMHAKHGGLLEPVRNFGINFSHIAHTDNVFCHYFLVPLKLYYFQIEILITRHKACFISATCFHIFWELDCMHGFLSECL